MTEFLVKQFVKNYQNTEDTQVRTSYGILSSCVGIVCNVLLFAAKLAIGMLMNSLAIMADAFNNLSDAASSIISFVGVKMAGKPADKEHPFGHGRIEYIAALIVAFLVIEVGITCLQSSFEKLFHPEAIAFDWISFGILLLSVGVKLWMSLFNRKLGKRIDSKVMLATAADSAGDVIVTSATLASILICYFTSVNIDAFTGLAVSVLVIWSGISIARDTLEPLIGQRPDPELYRQIQEMVESYDGIVGTHDLIIHNYGPNRSMASIHAEVPRETDIEVSHEIIDRVEREVARKLNIFLVIHMDPVEIHDEKVLAVKAKLNGVIRALDPDLTFHDFRVVNGQEQINLIFDLVIPFSYSQDEADKVVHQVKSLMKEVDGRYQCVITVDKNYLEG
ncbi:MAG TPA: cation diffusion facilitator family transporter [Candidatus Fusicatenibacter intestinigallinarum]|uniref:Cation diffusion facilitator family transporter n=1 Tax=Candidatus Fusicatenibacter intestinigallinarum TaxID=2838598 RepID=A0A9D2N9B0_9FIRM|nr:cation diffusion facilitator family transporter [Candidatus Fusicatenibacter intestinigallinarum]